MSDGFITQLNAARFIAQRAKIAQTIALNPPDRITLPGALTPIDCDRLEAHQDDGLTPHEIVAYENARHLAAHPEITERHARWVTGPYDAMVRLDRELKAQRQRQELEAAAQYQRQLEEMLARRDDD